MTENTVKAAKAAIVCALGIGLGACTTLDHKLSDNSGVIIEPRQVETLGETIAREQQGENGCLVAGNLNNGGDCKKLRESVFPPPAVGAKLRAEERDKKIPGTPRN